MRYSIRGSGAMPIWAAPFPASSFGSNPRSNIDKKRSQSSKPLRIDSSYPPQRSHAERRIMHVAGQQLCDTNAPASPPVGWTTESRTPNVRSQPEDATIESSAVSNGNVRSMKVGIKRSSPSSTTTNGVPAAAMPRLRAAEGPAFTWSMKSTATPPVSNAPCRQSSRIALNTSTDVCSSEPSSTMMMRSGRTVWDNADSTASRINGPWL